MEQPSPFNEHNKQEYPPMHTAEHILNQTMIQLFNCERSKTNHIEKKKSKCDYLLSACPTNQELQQVEETVNEVIAQHLTITTELIPIEEAKNEFDLSKLPLEVSKTLRIVRIGTYDACPCIGLHVTNTFEIGTFKIISSDYKEGKLRIRFKLI